MFIANCDRFRRLLRLTMSGHVAGEQLRLGLKTIRSVVADLEPEFSVLTDLSKLELMEASCVPYIQTKMDLLRERHARTVARVIPDPHKDIGFEIMSLFHYRHEVPTATFVNLDDALQYLDPDGKR